MQSPMDPLAPHLSGEAGWKTIVEHIADGVIVQDPSYRCVFANDAAAKLCGFTRGSELVAASLEETARHFEIFSINGEPFRPELLPARRALNGELAPPEALFHTFNRSTRQDFWSIVKARAICDPSGAPALAVSIFRDVTPQKNSDVRIQRSEEQLRAIIQVVHEGIFVRDREGAIVTANPTAATILGFNENKLHGRTLDPLQGAVFPDGRPMPEEQTPSALALSTGKPQRSIEVGIRSAGGALSWILVSAEPMFKDDDPKPFAAVTSFHDITDRKKLIDDLSVQSKVLESMNEGVSLADENGIIRYTNPTEDRMFGYGPGELIGKHVSVLNAYPAEENQRRVAAVIDEVKRTGHWTGEWHNRRKDGSTFATRSLISSVVIGGRPHFVCVQEDITDELQAARSLRESENQFRSLADSIPQLSWIADGEGYIYWYNQRWYDYTGTTLEEMKGWGWEKVHHPEHHQRVVDFVKIAWKKPEPLELTFPLRSKSGEYRWFLTRAIPLTDEQGRIQKWFGTNTDIHEQYLAKQRDTFLSDASGLLSSSLDYEATLQSVARLAVPRLADWCSIEVVEEDGPKQVAVAHPDPRMMSLAAELRQKYPPDWNAPTGAPNVIRTGKTEFYPAIPGPLLKAAARDDHHYRILMNLQMSSAVIVPLSARGRTLGTLSLVSTSPARVFSPEDIALAEEIGRRAGIAIDNARLYREAQDAVRIRDEFLSIASHELKTPLTSLLLQTQMQERLMRKDDRTAYSPERVLEATQQTRRQITRLTRLVDEMLDVARIRSGKLTFERERVDLCVLLDEVLERLKHHFIESKYPLPRVERCEDAIGEWDRLRIEQVATNLLTNAIRYGRGKPIQVRVSSFPDRVRLEIEDQGIGIPSAARQRIFERFERVHNSGEVTGLGLGLFIARQIVVSHGGTIEVESEEGQGSVFIVELPKAPPKTGSH